MKKYLINEQKHHDLVAASYSERRHGDYIWEVPEEIFLLKKKYFKKNASVVDMGCGPAISVVNVLGKDVLSEIKYIGIDISPKMLKIAKKNIPFGKFLLGDIGQPKLLNKSQDVIISLGALHHSEDKIQTIRNWAKLLKKDGYILLREPTYEALKRGEGESPGEEGIKFDELMKSIRLNRLKIQSCFFFSTPVFHLFNRILIKIGLSKWQTIRFFWYPVVLVDTLFANTLGTIFSFFRGEAFALILKKA